MSTSLGWDYTPERQVHKFESRDWNSAGNIGSQRNVASAEHIIQDLHVLYFTIFMEDVVKGEWSVILHQHLFSVSFGKCCSKCPIVALAPPGRSYSHPQPTLHPFQLTLFDTSEAGAKSVSDAENALI